MGTVANLLAGTGTLYVGPTGESLPELDDITPPTITVTPAGNWSATGFTESDFVLTYTPTWDLKYVNEHNLAVGAAITQEEATFKVTLAEQDMTAWDTAMSCSTLSTTAAGADQTAQDILKVGDGRGLPDANVTLRPVAKRRLKTGNSVRLAIFVLLVLLPLPWVWLNPGSRIPDPAESPE